MSEHTTARMIDAIEHPMVDQRISITTRAKPLVDELLAEAYERGHEAGYWDGKTTDMTPAERARAMNPYRPQGEP